MSQDLADALRECHNLLAAANETFAMIYSGKTHFGREEWLMVNDLNAKALHRADQALHNFKQTAFNSATPLSIREWLASGELSLDLTTTNEVYESAGQILDKACSYDILGPVLFQGEDRKFYTMTVEAVLGEASEDFVKSMLPEDVEG